MKITYHGHSCFLIEGSRYSVIFDPFLKGNPLAKIKPEDVKVDAILVSHGHFDHVGDAVEISKNNDATIITPFELASYFQSKGAKSHPMNIGGSYHFPFGTVKLTIAHHGSTTETGTAGNPCGFILIMEDKVLYHAGDTGLFSDMRLIGELNTIDVALIPIGDNFTMGITDALKAVEFLKPKIAIPMHYNTFDMIKQDPRRFVEGLGSSLTRGVLLMIGESISI
ncbi:MAG: metal-dependent hydrolase [Candidatus Jettenia sp. CY-1]|nr:MAG: metal-dependent hydrolase [Candidatus Jettenia sp. CY-1]